MHYLKKLAGQTAIYGLSSVVPRLLNYFLIPLYTRVFLPEEYGIVTEMYAYIGFLLVFLTFGMETGYFRFAGKEKDDRAIYSTAFYSLLVTSTIFILIVFLFARQIVTGLGYSQNPEYVILLSFIVGLDAFCAIPFARLRLQNRALTFSVIKIVSVLVNVLLNLFFLKILPKHPFFLQNFPQGLNLGITYVFISNVVSSSVTTILLLHFVKGFPPFLKFEKLKPLIIYSLPLLISGLGGTTNESFDRIFIKYLVPEENNPLYQLGIYGSNVKLAVLMVLFIQMYRYAAEPFFFANIDRKDSPEIYASMLKYFVAFTLLIFLGVALFTDIFKYLVGKNFREGLDVVPILLMANLLYGIFFNLSIWYKVTNKTWYGIYYTFAGATLTILLNIILIPRIGFYGAAVARLACYSLMCVLCIIGGNRHFPIPYDGKKILIYIGIALLIFFICYFAPITSIFYSYLLRVILIGFFILFFLKNEKVFTKNFKKYSIKWR